MLGHALTPRSILPTKSRGSPSSSFLLLDDPAETASRGFAPMIGRESRKYHNSGRRIASATMVRSTGAMLSGQDVGCTLATTLRREGRYAVSMAFKGQESRCGGTMGDQMGRPEIENKKNASS